MKKKEKPKAIIYPKKLKFPKKKEIKNNHIRELFELLELSEDSKKEIKIKPKKSKEQSSSESESENEIKGVKKRKARSKEIKIKPKKSKEQSSSESESENEIKEVKKRKASHKRNNKNLKKYTEISSSESESENEILVKNGSTDLNYISKYSHENTSSSRDYTEDSIDTLLAALELDTKEKDINESNKKKLKNDVEKDNYLTKDKGIENKNSYNQSNFIIKKIEEDGNCFYRTLSYFFRETEKDHLEFRELITNYILNNAGEYIFAVTDDDINLKEDEEEENKIKKKEDFIVRYAETASKEGEWAGDIEIATACTLFDCNINMYTIGSQGYNIYHKYGIREGNSNINKEVINILYINNIITRWSGKTTKFS